jgi:hypothetical protein
MGSFYVGFTSYSRSPRRKACCGGGPARDESSIGLSGWSSAISSERSALGCGFNPAYPRGCGWRFMFPEKWAYGVESMNPTCRIQFWLRFGRVGTMALGATQLVGDLGRVVAFDGDPENVERSRGNSVRNGLEGHSSSGTCRCMVAYRSRWNFLSSRHNRQVSGWC